jgi:hypothetical protein
MTLKEINGWWTCKNCGYKLSAMLGDDELPDRCPSCCYEQAKTSIYWKMIFTECQNCGRRSREFKPLEEVKDLLLKIAPGEIVPAGECLSCGALVHKVEIPIKVQDNGGETFDQYTVTLDRYVFTMSHNANSPQGVNQFAGEKGYVPPCNDPDINPEDWPEGLKKGIETRIEFLTVFCYPQKDT